MSTSQRERQAVIRRKAGLALLVPLIGLVLLVSPLLDGFTQNTQGFVNLRVLFYIFGVWAILILVTLGMSYWLVGDVPDKK